MAWPDWPRPPYFMTDLRHWKTYPQKFIHSKQPRQVEGDWMYVPFKLFWKREQSLFKSVKIFALGFLNWVYLNLNTQVTRA